jgi:hypothetical protein
LSLEAKFTEARSATVAAAPVKRSTEEVLTEILDTVRAIERRDHVEASRRRSDELLRRLKTSFGSGVTAEEKFAASLLSKEDAESLPATGTTGAEDEGAEDVGAEDKG